MTSQTPYRVSKRFQNMVQHEKLAEFIQMPNFSMEFSAIKAKNMVINIEKELFQLQKYQANIIKRQSELIYILEDLWLDEQATKIKAELHVLMSQSNACTKENDNEDRLMQLLIRIIDQRDKMLVDLDNERLRELEEARELLEEYEYKQKLWSNSYNDNGYTNKKSVQLTGPTYHSLLNLVKNEKSAKDK